MRRLTIDAGGGYDMLVGPGLLDTLGGRLANSGAAAAAVVCDRRVNGLYGDRAVKSLESAGLRALPYVFDGGEDSKNLDTVSDLLEFLARNELTRSDCIVALGGGICGDIAGFCASVYQRGVSYIQAPTTLLAAVDSSVGGKTGVNLPSGKNLAGAFWQPKLVLCDTDTLLTLSPREMSDGMAEVIKYGVLEDAPLLEALRGGDWELEDVICRCAGIKAGYVALDERDTGQRQMLNLGHTFGHAIEKASGYCVTHGSAVAVGMVMAARAARYLSVTRESCVETLISLLVQYGLPVDTELSPDALLEAMTRDKKRAGNNITLVLPERPGRCVLHKVTVDALPEILNAAAGRG